MTRTNVYVDGFNLYYGAVKNTPYRWLDISALCLRVLPGIDINRIRYFTAPVKSPPDDPTQSARQAFYLRALRTLPNLSIHEGHYLQTKPKARLVKPLADGTRYVRILKSEEKGSDVNLATYLLVDAFRKDYDQAIVISNDSDLTEPIRIITRELLVPVGVFNPHTQDSQDRIHAKYGNPDNEARKASPSVELRKAAKFFRDIRSNGPMSHVALSQFPRTLTDAQGSFSKPPEWDIV